jgi:hypothetical protein
MTTDPDLERGLERLMTRVRLPEPDRWVPTARRDRRATWAVVTIGAIAAALIAAIGLSGLPNVASPGATPSPLQTLPGLVGPTPSGTQPPRGTASLQVIVALAPDDAFMVAADDGALAHVRRAPDNTTTLYVSDFRSGQRRTIATTPGRFIWLRPGGIRRDLVTYVEQEVPDPRATAPRAPLPVIWHVMVANWRTGAAPKELEAIPGAIGASGSATDMPHPVTNGNEVVWLHAPIVGGVRGDTWIARSDGNRGGILLRGEARYAIDDRGRIAVSRSEDVANTSWDLLLYDGDGAVRRIVMGRGQGGTPYIAGTQIVWARTPPGPGNVTSVDVVDIASGTMRPVAPVNCTFVGATVADVVFACGARSRLTSVDDLSSTEMSTGVELAEAHAIISRDAGITVTPVP